MAEELVIVNKADLEVIGNTMRSNSGTTDKYSVAEIADAIANSIVPNVSEPYKTLVTDGNGETVWENRLAYKTGDKVLVNEKSVMLEGDIMPEGNVDADAYDDIVEGIPYYVEFTSENNNYDGYVEASELENGNIGLKFSCFDSGFRVRVWKIDGRTFRISLSSVPVPTEITISISAPGSIKPIDPEYIAEGIAPHKQLVTDSEGKTVWEDKLAWKEERLNFIYDKWYEFCKISDEVPSVIPETIAIIIASPDGTTENKDVRMIQSSDNAFLYQFWWVVIAKEDNATYTSDVTHIVFPEKGIYLLKQLDTERYLAKATWDGYSYEWDGNIKTIKTIDPEYLPDNIGGGSGDSGSGGSGALIIGISGSEGSYEVASGISSMQEVHDAIQAGRGVFLKTGIDTQYDMVPLSFVEYTYSDPMFANSYDIKFFNYDVHGNVLGYYKLHTKADEMEIMPEVTFINTAST